MNRLLRINLRFILGVAAVSRDGTVEETDTAMLISTGAPGSPSLPVVLRVKLYTTVDS